uniref:Uncharacterized protein n=1 Tax=Arundo donax TaxID=35708 RepID=A0A0A9C6E9_ARUDO
MPLSLSKLYSLSLSLKLSLAL